MRIALLNLPLDSNYGGNLQRYALVRVLSDMGHEVVHLNTHFVSHTSPWGILRWWIGQLIKRYIIGINVPLSREGFLADNDRKRCETALPFYERYIPHTSVISNKTELLKFQNGFDAYIVGSDQIWRKSMTKSYGLTTYLFDFLSADIPAKRIAYAASMGTDADELSADEVSLFRNLYKRLTAVSVREDSALQLLQSYGCTTPHPVTVLDPTMLLEREDYERLTTSTVPSSGNLFCYILDPNEEKHFVIKSIQQEKNLTPFFNVDAKNHKPLSIEQWLRSFMDAEMIVTDSYHGFVFSLIFQKPVKVILNEKRGNSRFTSLASVLGVDLNLGTFNTVQFKQRMELWKNKSIVFLKENINES